MNPESKVLSPYLQSFLQGRFRCLLRWEELDALWATLLEQREAAWHAYDLEGPPPTAPLDGPALREYTQMLTATLRGLLPHQAHLGIVYADDPAHPTFVKVYHPRRIGGCSTTNAVPVLPGWALSHLPPEDVHAHLAAQAPPAGRFSRLVGRLRG